MKKSKILLFLIAIILICCMVVVLSACEFSNDGNKPEIEKPDNDNVKHTHVWSQEYSIGNDCHWYACSGCSEKKEETRHSYLTGKCVCGKYIEGTDGLSYAIRSDDENSYEVSIGEIADCENIIIASMYNNKPVTAIARQGFAVQKQIKNVVIPESVKVIKYGAFYQTSNLESVVLSEGITSIEQYAFRDCTSLVQVDIPNSVTDLADAVFYNCQNLTELTIGDNVTDIKSNTFTNCGKLKNIKFGDKLNSIGTSAFKNCTNIVDIVLPSTLEEIGNDAFSNCSGLNSCYLGNQVITMGKNVFSSCYALTIYCEISEEPNSWNTAWNSSNCPVVWDCKNNDIANNGNIYVIENGVRYELKNNIATISMQSHALTGNIIIADSITYKNQVYIVKDFYLMSAFADIKNIEKVEIGKNITEINDETFYNCTSLKEVKFGLNITSIDSWAFAKCTQLKDIHFNGSIEEWNILISNSATDWDEDTVNYTVHCNNGNIEKS